MCRPYSLDLRKRVVAAVRSGLSRREAAAHFSIGISTAIRWTQREAAPAARLHCQ
jgi:putative transposase